MSVEIDLGKEYAALDKQLAALGGSYRGLSTKNNKEERVSFIPTGCISLDKAIKGIAIGRVYEIYGPTGSAKSSIALLMTKAVQEQGYITMWQDIEAVYTDEYSQACGVDSSKLILSRPATMNDALEGLRIGIGSGLVKLAVVDSVAAMVPKDEFDKEVGGGMIGTRARLMSSVLPQLVSLCSEHAATIIFLNQERASNLMGYGAKSTTSGGNALPYYASVRIDMNRSGWIEVAGEKVGMKITAQTVKNKTFTPFRTAEMSLRFMKDGMGGIDIIQDVMDAAYDLGVADRKGSWIQYNDTKYQGDSRFRVALESDKELLEGLRASVLSALSKDPLVIEEDENGGEETEVS